MIRTAASKAVLLAVATLAMGTVAVNCSGKKTDAVDPSSVGEIGLGIRLSPGVDLNLVNFKISGNGITPITGAIDTSNPGATATVLVSGLPAGQGYLVEVNGTATNGTTTCAGSATFAVVAGQSSSVTVALQCRTPNTNGSVSIGTTFNNCPQLTAYTASPLTTAAPAGTIAVGSAASDLDANTTLTYAWTATGGSFAAAASASTSYLCSASGPQTLTITVSDGKCTDSATIAVNCVALSCGNGALDPGEECDGTPRCNADCILVPVCGDGITEKNEQCDPPNGTTCDAQCRGIAIVCGNGIVQPGEACDPPGSPVAGGVCSAACQLPTPPRCGDGIVNQPSEVCDDGPNGSTTCNPDCTRKASACETCEAAQCDATLAGCGGLTGVKKTSCEAFVACIRRTGCATDAGDAQPCYCGTASDLGCLGGAGNGACKAEAEAAAESTNAEDVALRFVDPEYGLGRAANLIGCDATSCSQAMCVF